MSLQDVGQAYFTTTISRDLLDLICGKLLGSGLGRQVFEFSPDPTKVIKIEMSSRSFQNVIEWETWKDLKDSPSGKFLAPCHSIAPCGTILIMERTHKPHVNFKWPERMPSFLTDFKRTNYGLIGKRLVCHDYGTNAAVYNLKNSKATGRADWWNEDE